MAPLTRRAALLGLTATLGGCSAISALNSASEALDTYDLTPAPGATTGRRSNATLLVAVPEAQGTLGTDRIMVKPSASAVTFLPDARFGDTLPLVVQSLLVRSISATGRIAYVGRAEGGPVPDTALLVRIDAFQAEVGPDLALTATVDIALTLIRDADQRVIATRSFAARATALDDSAPAVIAAFQQVMDEILPDMADWAVQRA